jgi:hypothetical protein
MNIFNNLKPGDILITKFGSNICDEKNTVLYVEGVEYKFIYLSHGAEPDVVDGIDFGYNYVEVYCFTSNTVDKFNQGYFNPKDDEGLCLSTTVVQ